MNVSSFICGFTILILQIEEGTVTCEPRFREHLGINKKGNSVKGTSSAIRYRIKDNGHSGLLDDFCTIDKTNNELDLLIHESLLSFRDRLMLNFQSSSIPLCLF